MTSLRSGASGSVTTVACRACSAGWYGEADDVCPRCGGEVVVTDTFTVTQLREVS